MAKGRQRAAWERTAQLSALLANPNRDTKEHPEPFEPWEFNPFADEKPQKPKRPEIKMRVSCLKWLCENGGDPPVQPPLTVDQ
jgi:hypothetical protein